MPANSARKRDEEILDGAIRQAGKIAMSYYDTTPKTWDKSDGSPVTEADMAVDKFLENALLEHCPDYGWLSEESTDNLSRMNADKVWIVDPIDGTRSFIEKTGEWSISIGLIERGVTTLARIFRPSTNQLYAASLGNGAWLNGQPIHVTNPTELENCRMMTKHQVLNSSCWNKPWPEMNTGVVTSLALRLCCVADGSYDGALVLGNESDWDLVAGDLIIREAGGKVTDIYGDNLEYNQKNSRQLKGLMAAGKQLHRQMLEQTLHQVE